MIDIDFAAECEGRIAPAVIRTAALATLDRPDRELSVRVGSEAEIQALNLKYMGQNKVTDVLAFPAGDGPPGEDPYIGDLIICLAQAHRQAQAGGHSLAKEVELLAVHGTLHLLGHDHDTPEGKQRMWSRQAEILQALGNDLSPP